MSNFWNDIVKTAEEPIEAVVIGDMGWGEDYNSEIVPNFGLIPKMQVLTAEEAERWLSFETSYDFGAPKQPSVFAWTKNYVIFLYQYDGSTNIHRIPRNPVACEPYMPGG